MHKKDVVTFFLVFVLVFFVIFIGITQILGVPLWWIFRGVRPLSIVQPPKLIVEVSPDTPLNIGEIITVGVTNSSSKLPVESAEVSLTKDGMSITLYTDSQGKAYFEYFGEVTVVTAQKTGINPSTPVSIPKLPVGWIRNTSLSLGIAVVGGVVSGFTNHLLKQREK